MSRSAINARSLWKLFSEEIKAIVLFAALVLAITIASLFISSPGSQIGTLRSLPRIPGHGVELAVAGAAVAAVSFPFSRRLDVGMILVGVSSVILLDLDHLPVILALPEPIRPAHSFVFLAFTFVILEVALRRRPDLGLMVVSGSLVHMAVDTGLYPLLSPISFQYFRLTYWWPVPLALSLVLAALAGYARRRTVVRQNGRLLFKTATEEARKP